MKNIFVLLALFLSACNYPVTEVTPTAADKPTETFAPTDIPTATPVVYPTMGAGRPLIVMMGQSNMSGRGPWVEDWSNPLAHVFNENGEWELARGPIAFDADDAGHGPINQFVDLYAAQFGEIGLVPCSVGGSQIIQWERGQELYEDCAERILAAGGNVKAVLFFQGEAEAVDPAMWGGQTVDNYANTFKQVIEDLRRDIGYFPLVFAQIGPYPEGPAYLEDVWHEIQRQQAAIAIDCAAMIVTSDLENVGAHFTNPSYDEIGQRFFDAFTDLGH